MKKIYLHTRDLQILGAAFVVALVVGVILWALPGSFASAFLIPANLLIFGLAAGYLIRRDQAYKIYQHDPASNYYQVEALVKLFSILKFDAPLPQFRNWAASPDCAVELVRLVMDKKCKTIVECGSGISTLIHAQTLKQQGGGHVYSLDHDAVYAEKTRAMLRLQGLSEFATVITAPLENASLENRDISWYSLEAANQIPDGIDLLFVDGPPGPPSNRPDTRFPAFPALKEKFSKNVTIVMDDYIRQGEKQVVRDWIELIDHSYEKTELETEKGTCILEVTST